MNTVPAAVATHPVASIPAPAGDPRPNAILEAVVFAAESFLKSSDWESSISLVLGRLGAAAAASRAYMFENRVDDRGVIRTTQRHEWVEAGISVQLDNPALQDFSLSEAGLGRWEKALAAGEILHGVVADMPASEQALLVGQDIRSLAVVPVIVDGDWCGFIGFDDCVEDRVWSAAELSALRAAADMFGAMVARRRIHQDLEASEARFHRLVEATVEGIVIHDGERVVDANPSFAAALKYSLDDVIGRNPFEFLAPESHDVARRNMRADFPDAYDVTGLRSDGSRFPAEIKGTTIRHDGGMVRVVAIRDLTERLQAEQDLRESQRMLATLMSNLPGMAYRCQMDVDWTMEFVSEGAHELTGYTPEDLVDSRTTSYGSLIHPEDRDEVTRAVETAVHSQAPFRMVYRIRPASGPEKWVWEQGRGVFAPSGELQWLEGFITDVTEAKQAEENAHRLAMEQTARAAAQASQRRADLLAEASRLLATSFDYPTTLAALARLVVPGTADYCTVDLVNRDGTMVRVGAVHADASQDSWVRDVAHSGGENGVDPVRAALDQGRSTLVAGSLITVPLAESGSNVGALTLGIAGSGRRYTDDDVALAKELARRAALAVERARLFQDAQQATRSRDRVLAVVAHDLRNPLNTALMATELLLEMEPRADQRPHLEIIRRSSAGMDRLIQDLLDTTRMDNGRLAVDATPQEVQPLIDEAMSMLRPQAAARSIQLLCLVDPGLPRIRADGPRILQVLSNLVGNAIKFTPPGGRIEVLCTREGSDVRFAVTDTGPGIPPEQIPHIFGGLWQGSPTDRRGIGLGLSIARGLVEAHGGRIWVECDESPGSRFYFTIPAASEA